MPGRPSIRAAQAAVIFSGSAVRPESRAITEGEGYSRLQVLSAASCPDSQEAVPRKFPVASLSQTEEERQVDWGQARGFLL